MDARGLRLRYSTCSIWNTSCVGYLYHTPRSRFSSTITVHTSRRPQNANMSDIKTNIGTNTTQNKKVVGEALDIDDAALRAQGREAELKRSFSWVGALGLAFG